MRVNRLNPVQKGTYLKKIQKWEKMKNSDVHFILQQPFHLYHSAHAHA